MEKERNITPVIAVIILVVLFVGVGTWFFIGRNKIVRGVPVEGSSDRVILVTPRATPTVQIEPTIEEEATPVEEDTPTKAPAEGSTATPKPEKEATPTPEE